MENISFASILYHAWRDLIISWEEANTDTERNVLDLQRSTVEQLYRANVGQDIRLHLCE